MPRFKLPNASLHYQEHGEGQCIAFLHGSGGNHLSWWQQIPALSQHYRCLVLDLRGFGLSHTATPPRDPAIFGDDLRLLLDHLNIARAHIVGQSIGGHYALRFALRHPDRVNGLVLADTLAGIADDRIAAAKAAAGPIPEDFMDRALGKQFRSENENLTSLYQAIERLNRADRPPETLVPPDVVAAGLVTLKNRMLFVVGEHDPVAPPHAVSIAASLIAGAQFKLITNSGHSAYFEQPRAFNQSLLEFFGALA